MEHHGTWLLCFEVWDITTATFRSNHALTIDGSRGISMENARALAVALWEKVKQDPKYNYRQRNPDYNVRCNHAPKFPMLRYEEPLK